MRILIFIIAALLPTHLIRFHIGPFPTTLLEILLLITIVTWAIRFLPLKEGGDKEGMIRIKLWWKPITILLLAGLISIIVAPNPVSALGLFRAYLLEPILFFFVLLSVLRDERDVRRLFVALGISALAISVYAIYQRFTGFGIPAPWEIERRVTSFYPYPNAVGLFLGPLIPLFTALTIEHLQQKRYVQKPAIARFCTASFFTLTTLFLTAAIIFSKTEAAWVGIIGGLLVIGLSMRKLRVLTIIITVLAAVVIAFTPTIRGPVMQKLLLRDWSGQVRLTQWRETVNMLRDRPIFGAGLAGYPTVIKPYHKATYIEIFQYPHNIILNFWSELGLLGLLAFVWLLLRFFRLTTKTLSLYRSISLSLPMLGLTAGMLTLLIHGLVDVPYFKNDLAIQFWILIAAATILANMPRQNAAHQVDSS